MNLKACDCSLDIQLLYHLRENGSPGGVLWNPSLNKADIVRLGSGQELKSREWILLLRELKKRGLADKYAFNCSSSYNQKTLTLYKISPKGRKLLEGLGL